MLYRTNNLTNRAQKNDSKIKTRESSFELLRIVSMFFIVICHFATHGGFSFDTHSLSVPRFWWYFIEMGGNLGVDVFVLITGYFLIKSQNTLFNIKKVLKIWGQIFFYSVLLYVIFGILGINEFSLRSLVATVFPIIFNQWWFASTYFVVFLIHPFLNIFLNKLNQKTYQSLLILLVIIWCIIPTISLSSFQSNPFLWFITLYCVAGYIRIFDLNQRFGINHYLCVFILCSALRYASAVILIFLGTKVPFVESYALVLYEKQSVLTFLSSLSLFMTFKNISMVYHRGINIVASACFGVYLIHDNKIVRPFLWHTVFKNTAYQSTVLLIPYSIGVACLIYVICTLIDLLRQVSVEKLFLSIVDVSADHIIKLFEKIISSCMQIVFGKQNQ